MCCYLLFGEWYVLYCICVIVCCVGLVVSCMVDNWFFYMYFELSVMMLLCSIRLSVV